MSGSPDRRERSREPSSTRAAAGLLRACCVCLGSLAAAQVEQASFAGGNDAISLGWSVSLSGSYAAVGSPGTHDNNAGYVHVYRNTGSTWSQVQVLLGSTATKESWFGASVALDGDVMAAGDWGDSGLAGAPGFSRGAAYVFRRPDSLSPFVEEARLQPADLAEHDRLGTALDLSGEVLVVSAPGADDAGPQSGAAYVFRHAGGTWTQEARLIAPQGVAWDRFGFDVAVSGGTIAIGAEGDDQEAPDAGAVHVFVLDGGAWTLQATLVSAAAGRDDRFGTALDLQGDQLAVSVPRRDVAGRTNAGVVEVWRRSGSVWSLDGVLSATSPVDMDNLGLGVALDGDRVLAGIPNADAQGGQAGAAILFQRSGGVWTAGPPFAGSLVDVADQFGVGVALDGPLAVVGAPQALVLEPLSYGRVHLFGGMPGAGP